MAGITLLVHSGHKICAGQRVEQVLLIDAVDRKGENDSFGVVISALTVVGWFLARSTTTAVLLLCPESFDSKRVPDKQGFNCTPA